MKIFAVGRNFVDHINELNNERPGEPVIFTKPDTSLLKNNSDFYIPHFSQDIHYEVELVLRISKVGKNIAEKFAHKYYDQIGLGIDFTARDLQSKAKSKGLPWAIAKGFDGSAPISEFKRITAFKDLNNVDFSLKIDGEMKQHGNTALMLFNFDYIVSYLSGFFTLKKGDFIFTGTPKGVGPIAIGQKIEGFIEDEKMLEVHIK